MDLNLNETQKMLSESGRALLGRYLPQSKLANMETSSRGYDEELWRQMVEAGWTALGLPETAGLKSGDLIHLGVLLEEMGRAALASPFFQTVLTGLAVGRYGNTRAAAAVVAKIAGGARAALILPVDPVITPVAKEGPDGDYILDCNPHLLEWGHHVDLVVCAAKLDSEGAGLFVLEPGLEGLVADPVASFDSERIARVSLRSVRVDRAKQVAKPQMSARDLDALRAVTGVLRAAEMVGGGRRVLEMTVEHLSNRKQFGHPIAAFQAVQHACADVAIQLDGARLATYEALWSISNNRPFVKQALVAALFTGQACERAVTTAAQLFGGIGYTREYYLHFYYRRAKAQQLRLGTSRSLLEALASELFDSQREPVGITSERAI
jgi:alkylation response protein AidB-like acyl-CoA dehydrogenase